MYKRNGALLSLVAVLAVLVCSAGIAIAQDDVKVSSDDKPMFVTLPPRLRYDVQAPQTSPLTTWNGAFTYSGKTYNYNMVGTVPSTGTSTTIPVYMIPLKIVVTAGCWVGR